MLASRGGLKLLTGLRPCAFQGTAVTSPSVYSFFDSKSDLSSYEFKSYESLKRKVPHPYLGRSAHLRAKTARKRGPETRPSLTGFGMTDIKVSRVLGKFEATYPEKPLC